MPDPIGRCLILDSIGGVTVARLRCRASEGAPYDVHAYTDEVGDELDRLGAERGASRILLDLAHFEALSHPTELARLVRLGQRVQAAGGSLKLLCPQPGYREMLRITLLDRVFEVHEAEHAALASAW